jgi:hypothetical protein
MRIGDLCVCGKPVLPGGDHIHCRKCHQEKLAINDKIIGQQKAEGLKKIMKNYRGRRFFKVRQDED